MTEKKTLEQLYQIYPFNGPRFINPAIKEGYTKKEIKDFLAKKVIHDQKPPPPKYIPIVSKSPGSYQMDTFINEKKAGGNNYLMLINTNTRKAFVYSMKGKGSSQVKAALNQFIKQEPNVKSIVSDQDAAYLSEEVLTWMKTHNIHYSTTTDDNHNKLGIINRFMRTIRDMAVNKGLLDPEIWEHFDPKTREFEEDYTPSKTINAKNMKELVDGYNNTIHKSTGYKPDKMTAQQEQKYIQEKKKDANPYNFKEGDIVKVVNDKNKIGKNRRQVSLYGYKIDSRDGNLFNVIAADKSINAYPGYKLVKAKGMTPIGKSLKNEKRTFVDEILDYDEAKDKYKIKRFGGEEDYVPSSYLRESHQTTLSRLEREYWLKRKNEIPPKIRRFI